MTPSMTQDILLKLGALERFLAVEEYVVVLPNEIKLLHQVRVHQEFVMRLQQSPFFIFISKSG